MGGIRKDENQKVCKFCGQPLMYKEDKLGRPVYRKFCSDKCKSRYFREKRPEYFKDYMQKRRSNELEAD